LPRYAPHSSVRSGNGARREADLNRRHRDFRGVAADPTRHAEPRKRPVFIGISLCSRGQQRAAWSAEIPADAPKMPCRWVWADERGPSAQMKQRAQAPIPNGTAAVLKIRECLLGNEAVDGVVGVVLKDGLARSGKMSAWSTTGPLEDFPPAGVEHAAAQGRVGDTVGQSLRAHVKLVGDAQAGHDVLSRYAQRQCEVIECLGVVLPGLMQMNRRSGYWRAR
jgi:hypothetical protein